MINELILVGVSFFHPHVLQDSTGTEVINGKVFVIHQVGEKETLYGISRRYGTTVDCYSAVQSYGRWRIGNRTNTKSALCTEKPSKIPDWWHNSYRRCQGNHVFNFSGL